jgi:hypothetical protein
MPFGDSGSTKTKNQTAVTSSAPWDPVQPGLKKGIADIDKLYASGGFNIPRYQGATLADTSPETAAGWTSITNTANDPSKGVGAALDYNNAILKGDYSRLDPMISRVRDAVGSNYEAAGRYGSGYHDRAVATGVGDVLADASAAAVQAAPGLSAASFQPGQALLGVGKDREATAQAQIAEAIKAYYADKQQPISNVQDYMAALSGNWGGTSSQTAPVPTGGGTNWQDIFGAGLGAGGLALSAYGAGAFG